jgi:20S proteasome subunit beta 5
MITGFDHKGGHLYYLDNDGNRIEGDKFSIGSGSTYAYGVLDTNWRFDLTLQEAIELGKRAISEATYHDSASGGVVNVYHVYPGGWTKVVDQ